MFPAMKAVMLVLAVGLPALCRAAPPRNMKAIELVGHVTDLFYTHNWRIYHWRKDLTFQLKNEKSGETWRVISREATPHNSWLLGPTYTGLKVDWKRNPRVKVIGVEGIDRAPARFYNRKFTETLIATAFIVLVETAPGKWQEFFVNNWFHRWGPEADGTIHAAYADKKPPYEIYGWIVGKRAPFSKASTSVMANHPSAKVFRGFVRSTKENPFGFELEITHLIGRDPKTKVTTILHGDPKQIPRLNTRAPEKK